MIPKSHFNLLLALSLFFLSFLAYIYITQQYQIQLLQYQLLKLRSPTPALSPTPIPTSSSATSTWQTYENKEWGISFLYPENYFFEKKPNNPNTPIYFWKNGSNSKPYYNYNPVLGSLSSDMPTESPLLILQNYQTEINKFLTSEDGGPIDMIFIKDIKNINTLLKVYSSGQDIISQECAVETPQKTTVTISCSDDQLKDPIFQQILSTFKFTN